MSTRPPVALTIATSDPSGGAGIQADLKTFSALGVYGTAVLVALTAQSTRGVTGVHVVPSAFITEQIDTLVADVRVDVVKIGMLAESRVIHTVADALRRHRLGPVVLDPVMIATSGDRLLAKDAVRDLREQLVPLADLLTPNLPEAAALLDDELATTRADVERQAAALRALGARRVLLKGGHAQDDDESADLYVDDDTVTWMRAPRVHTSNTHGTGCTLSSAVAALRPQRLDWASTVRDAKAYVTQALAAADTLAVGSGSGPVHHFHAWWGTR